MTTRLRQPSKLSQPTRLFSLARLELHEARASLWTVARCGHSVRIDWEKTFLRVQADSTIENVSQKIRVDVSR